MNCKQSFLLCLALGHIAFATQAGAEILDPREAWTFTLHFENDLFADTDRHYTNGLKLSWISPDLKHYRDSGRLPEWTWPIVDRLPLINEPGLQRNVAFSIGQKIFTPDDIQRRGLVENDRPYAGWLYFGNAFHNKNARLLDTFEIQLGVVGPAALAEQTQNFVHDLRGIDEARGWDNQLHNEPGVLLIAERKWRALHGKLGIGGASYDLVTHVGAGAGNVYTYANAGLEARLGWNIPIDFGNSIIRPGGDTNAPVDSSDPRLARIQPYGLHLFAAATGRAVARDIFLDGNSFRDSHSVDKEWLVGDFVVGISGTVGRLKLSYAQVFRSKEFRDQEDGHEFGSLSLSLTY